MKSNPIIIMLDYRNNSRQNDHSSSGRPNNNYGYDSRHINHNQYSRSDQNAGNSSNNYGRQQSNYGSGNSSYPNYGSHQSSGQQSTNRNDRPGYFTSGYQANNSQ